MDTDLAEDGTGELCYSQNLLQRFAGKITEDRTPPCRKVEGVSDSSDVSIELRLGISLGSCFEVDPANKRLPRSSSMAAIEAIPAEIDFAVLAAPLVRACSLPAEAEEEQLKRKEMQGLKRMEFKRKRLEKRCSSRLPETAGLGRILAAAGSGGGEVRGVQQEAMRSNSFGFNGRGLGGHEVLVSSNSSVPPSTPSAGQKSASRAPLPPPPLRSLKSLQEEVEEDEVLKSNLIGSKDVGRNIMADMPFVSTKGGGQNGRTVEGFLYKYRRGEEVRIVCICHGSFHTPAEFVKHAGGGDVPHPLRQIVVNTSPPVYY